jgi:hypothetical protein
MRKRLDKVRWAEFIAKHHEEHENLDEKQKLAQLAHPGAPPNVFLVISQ